MSQITPTRAVALAGLAALAAAVAGCGKTGELERPAPLFGQRAQPGAGVLNGQAGQDPTRPVSTVDPREEINNPAPSRTVQTPGVAPDPTAPGPQGALPDPYANPR
jgi:hypothetical protein